MCDVYIGNRTIGHHPLPEGSICDKCLRELPRTEQAVKRLNFTEMTLLGGNTVFITDVGQKMLRIKKVMHLDKAAAFLFYEKGHPVQRLIHTMKYNDQPLIGYQLGRQAAIEMQYTDFFEGIDVIVPVPLHAKRLRSRGYNQSEYIARGLGDITGIPVDTTHLTRIKNTPQQALQSGDDRKNNVADAFVVNHPEQMYHKHILVVDDLITTGETVRSCLAAMKFFRGAVFSVFALCKAL